ncbi:hypothetical protein QLQ12_32760 [Actinoplanes sp. NEAU-A12]|uniref:Uncharacterized protein n=1 Tax=Actinoplanes sandaracinus TaxID=3045177 RepID=A0ABT6WUG8_9ACTN|nr:hypothetical protein [Actinoplanes sandaracinus]MDI6103391.1 hypothetical protein [Actinoplanes sandaracinus]
MLGALVTALGALVAGSLLRLAAPPSVWVVLLVSWFGVIAAREFGLLSFGLPQNARLVPVTVFRHGRFFGPLQFGLEMGTGLRTYVTSGLPYVLLPAIALLASPVAALLAGLGFGLGRSIMTSSNLRFSDDNSWDLEFSRYERWIKAILVMAFAGGIWAAVI